MLQCRRWESTKNSLQHYRRRTPEQTQLYRLVYRRRDELPRVWEDRFRATYGVLRDEVLSTLDEYLNCGLLAHGAARVYCDTCKHSLLVAFSCKKRGICPSCGAKRLRVYFRYDRRLNNILFQAATTAVHSVLGSDTQIPALILTMQTAGEALNFNPHLHGLLASGTFDASGKFIPLAAVDTNALTRHFENEVLAKLVTRGLITDDDVAQILAQEHSGFGAWVGEQFEEADRTKFVARYIERGPISLEKLTIQDDIITYTTKSDFAKAASGHRPMHGRTTPKLQRRRGRARS